MSRAALVGLSCFLCVLRANGDESLLQLRIAWGGGAERIWEGSIRLSGGRFSELQPLGLEADEPGSIWLDDEGIEVRQRALRAYDGVDVSVSADVDATLVVSLSNEQGETAKSVEVPLRSLLNQAYNSTLDDTGNRLIVTRSPNDRLRITFERDHLVFSPGETLQFQLQSLASESGGGGALRYQVQVISSPAGQVVSSTEYKAGEDGAASSIAVKLPESEGVYDLSISSAQSRLRFRPKKAVAERKFQLVVVDSHAPSEASQGAITRVVEINPMNPRWWERFTNIPLLPGLRKGPLGNGDVATWEHPKLGPLIQLGTGGIAPNISWEAYPLPITNPAQPHLLEIEYPSDVPQAMGISLLEPNAAGAVTPIGLDSGVYVSDEEAESPPQLLKHRVLFWPRTTAPVLVVTNRRSGSRAVYGKITVLAAKASQFPALAMGRSENANFVGPAFTDGRKPERLVAGYLDRPLFVENFSAPEALDVASHRSLDDWNTFHQGGMRLVKYLKYVGYNGLMMSVWADGSTIYPSQVVQPTPRYDTGIFFGTGQDPFRKDGLELLFRLFDRENLTLIPALQFASPLPELEAIKREGGAQAVGLEWIGPDGHSWLAANAPRQGLAPYYNILDSRVQEAMLRAAREVAARYAAHASYGGLALQLSPDGYAQLPGDDWGYDDQTIAHFEKDTGSRVPGSGAERFAVRAKYLAGPGRAAWLSWRADVVAAFHRRLQGEIGRLHPAARLYLAGGTMLDNRQTQYRLRPTLPRRTRLDESLTELGIHTQAYRDDSDIVLLRPQHLKPPAGPLPAQAADLEINLAPEMDKLFANTKHSASLFYHEPQKARLASFDAKSPFGAANTYTWMVSQMLPSGDRNRRRFVHSLATLDAKAMFDGGWLLPLGQEAVLKDILSVYRALPADQFETLAGEFQPVTIRTLARQRETLVYLVNDSAWDVSISMRVDLPADAKMEKLGDSRGLGPLSRVGGETTWKIVLRPYDLVGARFSAPGVRLRNAEVTISEQVRRGLQRKIEDLGSRVAALSNPPPLGLLVNPGFEAAAQGETIAGWTVNAGLGGSLTPDAQQKHAGAQSLKLVGTGQPIGITSEPFDPPVTGRLGIDVWLRTSDPARQPSFRIAVEGQSRDGKFDPYGVIPAVGANATTPGDWVRYSFPLDSLPLEGLGNLRIHFELLNAAEVWLDDVQIFDLPFKEAERNELSKLISLASYKLGKGQFADCALLLEGYWPQFLVAHVPLAQMPLAQRPRAGRVPGAPAAPVKKPTVLENLKGYLPRLNPKEGPK